MGVINDNNYNYNNNNNNLMPCLSLQNKNFLIMLFKSQSGVAYPLLNNDICVNNCLMGQILQFLLGTIAVQG